MYATAERSFKADVYAVLYQVLWALAVAMAMTINRAAAKKIDDFIS